MSVKGQNARACKLIDPRALIKQEIHLSGRNTTPAPGETLLPLAQPDIWTNRGRVEHLSNTSATLQ